MADVHIALVWILIDPSNRASKFIEEGLGAVKLEIAHRKRQLEDEQEPEAAEGQKRLIDYWEAWLQSQRLDQLVEINLGSWSGLNTRRMAEEANVLDFYNYVYQPFSAAVHSSWAHVSDKNTNFCENPAHRFHKVPVLNEMEPDLHWLYLAAKYLQKTFAAFDQFAAIKPTPISAFEQLMEEINRDEAGT